MGQPRSCPMGRLVMTASLVGLGIWASGCTPSPPTTNNASQIRLALNWFPDTQHAGFYAAEVFGEFARQQLSVRILPGGPPPPSCKTSHSNRSNSPLPTPIKS